MSNPDSSQVPHWTPWLISAGALGYAILKDVLASIRTGRAKRSQDDGEVARRLSHLEITAEVEKVRLDGELRLMGEKVENANRAALGAQSLLKAALATHDPG